MATLRDAVYGLAVGDALGVPFEFMERGSFECSGMVGFGTHAKPVGTWSDDTSLTLATCDSIREQGAVEPGDIRSRFRAWLDFGAYAIGRDVFDVGGTTARAIRSGVGCSGERDCGNGSLMRIVPLAFTDVTDYEVRAVSSITHAHPKCTEACVDFVRIARRMADGEPVREAMGGMPGLPTSREIRRAPAATCWTRCEPRSGASRTRGPMSRACWKPSTLAGTPTLQLR